MIAALFGCAKDAVRDAGPIELAATAGGFDARSVKPPAEYDPLRLAAAAGTQLTNADPAVPALCYTRTDGVANTCATCHTKSSYPNLANDWELQQNYPFHDLVENPWKNQFRDRRNLVARFTDDDIAAYVRTDNYAPLRAALAKTPQFPGWRPDIDLARGFDELGFARDGSGWRALRYKPFPGTFWPSGGSTDDAYIRLPAELRTSRELYKTNLAILEAAITADPRVQDAAVVRTIEPIDERASGLDLDRDGTLGIATKVVGLPKHYAGTALAVTRALYPKGVELLHTVRYLDPDAPAMMAKRMKELRYSTKVAMLEGRAVAVAHRAAEDPEQGPTGDPQHGYRNAKGWQLQGWIEDGAGWLRLQTHEEHQYCLGCHTNLGITVDQTFSFPRKLPGADGWRAQDPKAIPDAPQLGSREPEYAQYRARIGKQLEVFPTRARAWELDRAYLANVIEQSYVWGRDASVVPVLDAQAKIVERSTGLGEADRVARESQLLLDWSATTDADRSREARP
jgi:hypothetical protein